MFPFNGNLSNGTMFPIETNPETGQPLTAEYAERRARWEPVYEVTQIKGDGEAHPYLSPTDEFADYGTWDKGNLGPAVKTDDMLEREYARAALRSGLLLEDRLGGGSLTALPPQINIRPISAAHSPWCWALGVGGSPLEPWTTDLHVSLSGS